MRINPGLLALIALTLGACDSPTQVAGDLSIEIPGGFIGAGSVVAASLVNDSDREVRTGPLPCAVHVAKQVNGAWVAMPSLMLCAEVLVPVVPGGRTTFDVIMPPEVGAYRLQTDVGRGNDDEGIRVISRTFTVVGIRVDS